MVVDHHSAVELLAAQHYALPTVGSSEAFLLPELAVWNDGGEPDVRGRTSPCVSQIAQYFSIEPLFTTVSSSSGYVIDSVLVQIRVGRNGLIGRFLRLGSAHMGHFDLGPDMAAHLDESQCRFGL
ncbi:hypothetical protein P170DRAFT_511816 [Aspergillus steynii IBT 23096]|uniref:Uncharacterized protein n=1 Tax=Aspergillus steynii IBT 23096 TaxID=1392250 RepID=A0A2I2G2R5_9EURO|nr:uncharacterized protein P170DRAFT_511816 [Aspergillus steynii IBT 23096]PLB47174.1 hypothetical protein P170DRAFT_511816 [Aspergillus steynii IBT 23096]